VVFVGDVVVFGTVEGATSGREVRSLTVGKRKEKDSRVSKERGCCKLLKSAFKSISRYFKKYFKNIPSVKLFSAQRCCMRGAFK
jgi:hypothetical protein